MYKSKTPRFSISPFLRIVRQAFPILASGDTTGVRTFEDALPDVFDE
jgi:hypothetical protein